MAEQITTSWHTAQLDDQAVVPQVLLRLPMGDRIWGFITPAGVDPIGTYFDADTYFDAAAYFGGGITALEVSDRLVSLDAVEESVQPQDADVLGSWGQAQRPAVGATFANGDKEMSKIVGQEYTLNQTLLAYWNFPGLAWDFALAKFTGTTVRVVLKKNTCRIEAEQL